MRQILRWTLSHIFPSVRDGATLLSKMYVNINFFISQGWCNSFTQNISKYHYLPICQAWCNIFTLNICKYSNLPICWGQFNSFPHLSTCGESCIWFIVNVCNYPYRPIGRDSATSSPLTSVNIHILTPAEGCILQVRPFLAVLIFLLLMSSNFRNYQY